MHFDFTFSKFNFKQFSNLKQAALNASKTNIWQARTCRLALHVYLRLYNWATVRVDQVAVTND